jgi:hypothetical protein
MKVKSPGWKLIVLTAAASVSIPFALRHAFAQNKDAVLVQDPEEYAVYCALLNAQYPADKLQPLVIVTETESKPTRPFIGHAAGWMWTGAKWPETETETKSDFDAKFAMSSLLERRFDNLKIPYVRLTSEKLRAIFANDADATEYRSAWPRFYKQYPGAPGIISLSRVGFNSKKDQALVYVGTQSGLLGGSRDVFLLSKNNKTWEIQRDVVVGRS